MLKDGLEKRYQPSIDKTLQIALGKLTKGMSPAALYLAFFDWYIHFLLTPTKQQSLWLSLQENYLHLFKLHCQHIVKNKHDKEEEKFESILQDKRFASPSWQRFPFKQLYESFLIFQNSWLDNTKHIRGVSKHHDDVVNFIFRQILDMLSPSNYAFLNPDVIQTSIDQKGENVINGFENFLDDIKRYQMDLPPPGAENFVVGENVAITSGKVIYRNRLIELIQYKPKTDEVYAEPVLITPAWIMKYYILDLTPKHSLVKYLVKRGHTVFMISWKNPTKEDRNLSMESYLDLGIISALNIITKLIPNQKIHLVGYCLGGTLAAIAAAMLARDNDDRLASLTLFAAQTDFTEPGELGLFIDESQITFLESMMSEKGYLDTHQLAGAFQLLRSNDLVWSRLIQDYLLGRRKPLTDLMAWNADATRLPYKMHSEYLRQLFLDNQLAEGKYQVKEKPIALTDINVPIFVVATERDHVSPWRSVFKINILTSCDVTFVLTSGGHNVGIVSIPVKKTKRRYRLSTLKEADRYIDADNWFKSIKPSGGSWWPAWEQWLANESSTKVAPPSMGNNEFTPIMDAPGSYVLQK